MQPATFHPEDHWGRQSLAGMTSLLPIRKERKFQRGRVHFYHRVKNGVYDPISYYHALDGLLNVVPGRLFRTAELVEYLDEHHGHLKWDSTTLGRILNDMAESLFEANGRRPITATRRWNGMCYLVSDHPEDRAAMVTLLEDLYDLCDEEITAEKAGEYPKRVESPLIRCPSIMARLGE